jgi:hypothetical protein
MEPDHRQSSAVFVFLLVTTTSGSAAIDVWVLRQTDFPTISSEYYIRVREVLQLSGSIQVSLLFSYTVQFVSSIL